MEADNFFQYDWKPVLIQRIFIGFEAILEKLLQFSFFPNFIFKKNNKNYLKVNLKSYFGLKEFSLFNILSIMEYFNIRIISF